jgi:hypothetical protein
MAADWTWGKVRWVSEDRGDLAHGGKRRTPMPYPRQTHEPWLVAFLICLLAVITEGLLAGESVRQHLREIRLPCASPPMWLWLAIGLAYYVICYSILVRLLARGVKEQHRVGLLVLLLAVFVGVRPSIFGSVPAQFVPGRQQPDR